MVNSLQAGIMGPTDRHSTVFIENTVRISESRGGNMFRRVLLLAALAAASWSCSDDPASPSNGNGNPSPGTRATFSSIQATVFTPTCAKSNCHGGVQGPTLSDGLSYDAIINVPSSQGPDYIEPGDPDNSYLYRKVLGVNIVGQRMPRDGPPYLPDAVLDSIRVWIEQGALEN